MDQFKGILKILLEATVIALVIMAAFGLLRASERAQDTNPDPAPITIPDIQMAALVTADKDVQIASAKLETARALWGQQLLSVRYQLRVPLDYQFDPQRAAFVPPLPPPKPKDAK